MKTRPWFLVGAALAVYFSASGYAAWQQTAGPYGGNVFKLFVYGNNIFAGTSTGVYGSTDNGGTWSRRNEGLTGYTGVSEFVAVGSNLYMGNNYGVFLSTNNGAGWTLLDNGVEWWGASALAYDGADLFAGSYTGVFRSTNGGVQWSRVDSTAPQFTTLLSVESTLYAGTFSQGVYRSTNKGSDWTAMNAGLTNKAVFALALSGDQLFAGTFGGVFRSTNHGANWTAANTGMTKKKVSVLYSAGSSIYAGTDSGGVFVSTNNGSNWNDISNSLTLSPVGALVIKGNLLLMGTQGDAGIYVSTDKGSTWALSNSGFAGTSVYDLSLSGAYGFAGVHNKGGVFVSTDGGAHWIAMNNNLSGGYRDINALLPVGTTLFAGSDDGPAIFDGHGWSPATNGMTSQLWDRSVFCLVQNIDGIFAGTWSGVYRTTNFGAGWAAMNHGLTNYNVRSLAVSGSALLAGTDGGGIFRSTDNGTSWAAANTGLGSLYVYCFLQSGGSVYAGTGKGCYRSTNGGIGWTAANEGLDQQTLVLAQSGTSLFAGTYHGLFLSTNGGQNWVNAGQGAACTAFFSLYPVGSVLYAGTDMGVWKRPVSEFTGVDDEAVPAMPQTPVLCQNYPNPFNSGTVIEYQLKEPTNVTLAVYDLRGRRIKLLVRKEEREGMHRVEWSGLDDGNFPVFGGIYIYRLTAGVESRTTIFTRKMLMLK